jgi:predicted dienelactone hydrolase
MKTGSAGQPSAGLPGLFLLIGVLVFPIAAAGAEAGPAPAQFNVGYCVLDFKGRADKPALTVAVWYPTAATPKPFAYGGPTRGNVAVDAPPDADHGPYPLLVFSHGYAGGGLAAAFFTEALAARGWIVTCPDHRDPYAAVRIRTGAVKDLDRSGLLQHAKEISSSGPDDRAKFAYRLDEMACALNGMLASERFAKWIDRDHIAVGGHSFGGFTALGLCGTITERRDARIKAVLLFSTGAGAYLYRDDELASVRIPSMLFMGEREAKQRRGNATMTELSARIYNHVSPPKYFLEIAGASHFSFNNRFTDTVASEMLSGTEEQFEVIRRYSIAFLEKHVAGRGDAARVLEQKDPMLTRYDRELGNRISSGGR